MIWPPFPCKLNYIVSLDHSVRMSSHDCLHICMCKVARLSELNIAALVDNSINAKNMYIFRSLTSRIWVTPSGHFNIIAVAIICGNNQSHMRN